MTQCPHCSKENNSHKTGICPECSKVVKFDTKTTPFEIFNIDVHPSVDKSELDDKYIEKISIFHPDKFINKSPLEQEIASYNASMVNSAYQILSSPILTCKYILEEVLPDGEIASYNKINEEENDIEWIVESMTLHEELNGINNLDQCKSFEVKILRMLNNLVKSMQNAINMNKFTIGKQYLQKCQFLERIINTTQTKIFEMQQKKSLHR